MFIFWGEPPTGSCLFFDKEKQCIGYFNLIRSSMMSFPFTKELSSSSHEKAENEPCCTEHFYSPESSVARLGVSEDTCSGSFLLSGIMHTTEVR